MINKNLVVTIIITAVVIIALAFIFKKPDIEVVPLDLNTAGTVVPNTVVVPVAEGLKAE